LLLGSPLSVNRWVNRVQIVLKFLANFGEGKPPLGDIRLVAGKSGNQSVRGACSLNSIMCKANRHLR
jgi:hypothetical protein